MDGIYYGNKKLGLNHSTGMDRILSQQASLSMTNLSNNMNTNMNIDQFHRQPTTYPPALSIQTELSNLTSYSESKKQNYRIQSNQFATQNHHYNFSQSNYHDTHGNTNKSLPSLSTSYKNIQNYFQHTSTTNLSMTNSTIQ